jgi:hypothetical protein
MRAIREATDQVLHWIPPQAFKREYELRAGDEALATLRWKTSFGSIAFAESSDGTYSFKRCGFLRPRVTVRKPGSDENIAILSVGWGGEGTLDLTAGRRYQWRNINFWHSDWAFLDEAGELVVQFKPEPAFFQQAAAVRIEASALSNPDLPLLVTLGWYLMVLISDDTAAPFAVAR